MIPPSIRPFQDRVLIKRIFEEPLKTAAGLILEPNRSVAAYKAKILAVGEGKWCTTTSSYIKSQVLKEGLAVYVPEYTGYKFCDEKNEEYVVVREDDILATIA